MLAAENGKAGLSGVTATIHSKAAEKGHTSSRTAAPPYRRVRATHPDDPPILPPFC